MSNPNKKWSWGSAFGRGVGSAIGAGGAGVAVGFLGNPLGAILAGSIGAAGGFVGGFTGAALGYWWDDPTGYKESWKSGALYTVVVCGALSLLTLGHASPTTWPSLLVFSVMLGLVSGASRSLIDELWIAKFHFENSKNPWR